ncbi:MAG: LysM peptidoglycan-binding domain-containing protein [Altibacter sp.]|uniref:amino acid ABC transporter substrate-binding protein n=1 Tax=Altibacter sp. TaxID=2024823 RepID=UPI001DAF5753|nr:LysM peptidoglycan-binding domain-containing protein [Altibacter sp.]MBZ0326030.1 LysM peptidoglycan-binding domain-containing protein [Altibacter sp.]
MKLIMFIALVCMLSTGCSTLAQPQQYKTHTVEKGETVYSIAKKYNTTEAAIYKLNPDAKKGVGVNAVLIIPSVDTINEADIIFKLHRVKRRETLFGIAQLYNVQIDEIKKYNKELYSRELKKGERIRIPTGVKENTTTVISETNTANEGAKHTVLPKETKFGIARKYGITMSELAAMNPNLGESLQIGAVLNVPNVSVLETATIEDEKYDFYEVKPKEGFYRLKVKLGLSEAEIVALNPYAKDGLKDGMILKIPKDSDEVLTENVTVVNLENYINNKTKKRIALMLPFRLNKSVKDSVNTNTELLKADATMRIALDFYSGVLMAAEFAKDHGISVELDVYDTEASETKVVSIIAKNDFDKVDAVIGPLLRKNVEKAASELRNTDTPVFSPLSNKEVKISSNLFQTLPTDEMLQEAMLTYLKEHAQGKNMVLVSDSKKNATKQTILAALDNVKTLSPREKGFLYATDIQGKLDDLRENWIILESEDPVVLSNVVGLLNGMPENYKIRLFTLDKNAAYDYNDVSNVHLAKLGFTFPSVNKSYNYKDKTPFLTSYKNKYGVLPNRYAVRGFDVTYDVLLRLASADDVYDATKNDVVTEYIENKFHYTKKLFSGYQNNAVYIVKYNEELQFEEVK